jgi:ABC-type thiamin/hydroxymethylpyrimidine transport system permease subunit
MSDSSIVNSRESWTTSKLALIVVLGAINGALSTPIAMAWVALNDAFGVIGAALFQPFVIFTAMAGWLLPRPGVFLLCMVVSGFANMLTGDPSGIVDVYWGFAGGVAGEIAGLIFRWNPEKRTQIVFLFGVLYIPLTNVVTAFVYGWEPNLLLWVGLIVGIVAIVLESCLPGIALAKWLASSGLLRTLGLSASESS